VRRIGAGKYASKWVQAPATNWTSNIDFRGGDYKWWIAGWNVDGYGPWSSGTDFTILAMQPGVLGLVSPTGGVAMATGSINYQWTPDERATWYQLWSGRNGRGFYGKWYASDAIVSGSTATAPIPNHGWGDYGWWVRGWGPDGYGKWSGPGEFVVGVADPVSGAADTLTWNDSQTTSADWYQVQIVDVTGGGSATERKWWFKRDASADAGGGNRSIALDPALTAGDYEWYMRAWSKAHGTGPWSDVQEFTVP